MKCNELHSSQCNEIYRSQFCEGRHHYHSHLVRIISAFMSLEKGLAVLSTLLIQERVEQRLKPGFQRPDALFLTFSMLPHLK